MAVMAAPDGRETSAPPGTSNAVSRPVSLVLSARTATWRMGDGDHRATEPKGQAARLAVLRENQFTCAGTGCRFRSEKWQETHHRNDDHTDDGLGNLAPLCGFCHACFHLGRAAKDGATLLWLPEVPQGSFNSWLRMLYFGADSSTGIGDACRLLMSALDERERQAKLRLGFSDPAILAEALMMLDQRAYNKRAEKLAGLILKPAPRKTVGGRDLWPDQMAYWRSAAGPLNNALYAPRRWRALFETCNRVLGCDVVNSSALTEGEALRGDALPSKS